MSSSSSNLDNTSSSDSDHPRPPQPKKRKGVRNIGKYKCNVQKQSRLRGAEYTSSSTGRRVPAKTNEGNCSCKYKCTLQFSPEDRKSCLDSVCQLNSKNEQDVLLMGLIDSTQPVRRRSKKPNPQKRDNIFRYHVMKENVRQHVCKKAFCILYAIKNKALFRLTTLKRQGFSPNDLRGKHTNRGNAMPADIVALIDEHLKEFPLKESHYCNKDVKYLSADLNIKILHELFCKRHPDLAAKVKYDFYRNYYHEYYGYRFGRPQIDVCSTCEELEVKIKSPHLNNNAKRVATAEKIVHIRRANKFYKKQQEVKELCKEKSDVGAIVFDYMQNLPLPKIPVQEMFYLRKLWLYVFCIHDMKSESADFYVYPEGEAKRGPDEVCSLLWNNIQEMSPEIKELHVFSDACGGQNRNNTMVRFFLSLVSIGRFRKIHHYFPVRGHSFLQCDRNFGVAKRLIRRQDRIYVPDQYIDLIRTAKKDGFNVEQISGSLILDFKKWWPKFYKRMAKSTDRTTDFKISRFKHLEYSSPSGYVVALEYIDGLCRHSFPMQKPNTGVPTIPVEQAYSSNIPMNPLKMKDVATILQYIPDQYKAFYKNILTWPTAGGSGNNNEDDEADY